MTHAKTATKTALFALASVIGALSYTSAANAATYYQVGISEYEARRLCHTEGGTLMELRWNRYGCNEKQPRRYKQTYPIPTTEVLRKKNNFGPDDTLQYNDNGNDRPDRPSRGTKGGVN